MKYSLSDLILEKRARRFGPRDLDDVRAEFDADDASVQDMVEKYIQKIMVVYSSITDDDAAGLDETGFSEIVRLGGTDRLPTPAEDNYLAVYDYIAAVEPLAAAFKSKTMPSVDSLEKNLRAWALSAGKSKSEYRLELLVDASGAMPRLLPLVRKHYAALLAKSEAEPDAPLGRIALATVRSNMPPEPDTKPEKQLIDALNDHFEGVKLLSPRMASYIRDLMSQGLYPNYFAEPGEPVVFRGMRVSKSWLKKAIGEDPKAITRNARGSAEVNLKYKPRAGASSWTVSKKVAEDFHDYQSDYAITLYAYVSENPGRFLDARAGLYKSDGLVARSFRNEREALGLGVIQVSKIEWKSNIEDDL